VSWTVDELFQELKLVARQIIQGQFSNAQQAFAPSGTLSKWQFREGKYPSVNSLGIYKTLRSPRARGPLEALSQVFSNTSAISAPTWDAVAALLAGFIWKQGDWGKISQAMDGYLGRPIPVGDAPVVLYYFGRHLADPSSPIVDQHTVRAYQLLKVEQGWMDTCASLRDFSKWKSDRLKDCLKFGVGQSADRVYPHELDGFFSWHKDLVSQATSPISSEELDRLLFSFGKAAKACRLAPTP
jgi:hypothetical protein